MSESDDESVNACPECDSTLIHKRRTKTPPYYCNDCKSEFKQPINREKHGGGVRSGSQRLKCYLCDTQFFTNAESRRRVRCPHCTTDVNIWQAEIAFAGENQLIRDLATGPKYRSEVGQPKGKYRSLVHRLHVGGGKLNRRKSRPPEPRCVLYLEGDTRGAVSKYIEGNPEFVRDCLGDTTNPIRSAWPDHLYMLLVEQWHFLGYGSVHGGGDEC